MRYLCLLIAVALLALRPTPKSQDPAISKCPNPVIFKFPDPVISTSPNSAIPRSLNPPNWLKVQLSGAAQGTTYHITYYAPDSSVSQYQIDSVLAKIDTSLSIYNPKSLITRFNQTNNGIVMDNHFATVIKKSIQTFIETNGIFDITIAPIVQAWGFGPKKTTALPDSATLQQLKACVSSKNLIIKGKTLSKKKPCVTIDVNGIAQGYSVDVLAALFEAHGIVNYLVEVGGEIRVKGRKQPGNEKMKIGIEAPGEVEQGLSENMPRLSENKPFLSMMQKIMVINEGAITTSGSYRKFYESEGKKLSHLIDPRTAYPTQNELISVTVYARNAITADAYDNALMVMGLKSALVWVEKHPDIAAHFIYRTPSGAIADTASSRFAKLVQVN